MDSSSNLFRQMPVAIEAERALLGAMPLGKIKAATLDELCAIKGIGKAEAENIVAYFGKKRK